MARPKKVTLIQQVSGSDCVLASIAMARGCKKHSDIWVEDDVKAVIESKGVGDIEPWMKRAGYERYKHWRNLHIHNNDFHVQNMLWRRRALLSVKSLNVDGGYHMVYWDGQKLWDPHEGHYPEFLAYRHLSSLSISQVVLFDDSVPPGPIVKPEKADAAPVRADP